MLWTALVHSDRFVIMPDAQNSALPGQPSVLCLVDFSGSSEEALRTSIQYAVKNAARLIILYPYRLTTSVKNENLVKLKRDIEQEALRNFEKISNLLDGTNVEYEFRSEVGFLTDRIQEQLRRNNIKIIIINKELAVQSNEALNDLIPNLTVPLIAVPGDRHK